VTAGNFTINEAWKWGWDATLVSERLVSERLVERQLAGGHLQDLMNGGRAVVGADRQTQRADAAVVSPVEDGRAAERRPKG